MYKRQVNTVVNRNGKLTGYNTDYDGVDYLLHRHGILLGGRVVMILGTGGTSKTCAALARAKGCLLYTSSRAAHERPRCGAPPSARPA